MAIYFVDSVNGDNGSDGLSALTPLETISALPAVQSGDVINLACGSHWREQLTITVDNVTVQSYGSGDRPILDGSDTITDWSKTAGRSNVYEATVALEIAAIKTWVNVWEDNNFLRRAATVAACDSMPGSYLPSADTGAGPITVYVHSYDGTNPATNGKAYEVTARKYGLSAINRSQITAIGIVTRRNLHDDGSLSVGRYAQLTDCRFEDGSKHNVYYGDGSVLTDCVAYEAYYNNASTTLFVYNENTPISAGIVHTNCTAWLSIYSTVVVGFFGHSNVSGDFGIMQFINCTVKNLGVGFYPQDISSVNFENCLSDGCRIAYRDQNGQTQASSGISQISLPLALAI